jgi:hypothetical protein
MWERVNIAPREQGGFSERDTDECCRCFVFKKAFLVMEPVNGVVADAPGVGARRLNHCLVQARLGLSAHQPIQEHHAAQWLLSAVSGQCEENKTFSLQVPIRFDSNRAIPANHASPRQGATFSVPAQWRELSVRHDSGAVEQVSMRITGVGSMYVTEDVQKLTGDTNPDSRYAHNLLWGQSWVYAPSPCLYSGVGYYSPNSYGFLENTGPGCV